MQIIDFGVNNRYGIIIEYQNGGVFLVLLVYHNNNTLELIIMKNDTLKERMI